MQVIHSVAGARLFLVAWGGITWVLGCSHGPPSMTPPGIDADAAAAKAFELYDKNQDGALDESEVASCPGALANIGLYDANGDHRVDLDEMTARIGAWKQGTAMMTVDCRVTLDGRILEGAEVRYVPEPYLADWLHEGKGVTNADGWTSIGISPEFLAKQHQRVRAMNAGVYKVQITHPKVKIPATYNEATVLGREVSEQTRAPNDLFALKTK